MKNAKARKSAVATWNKNGGNVQNDRSDNTLGFLQAIILASTWSPGYSSVVSHKGPIWNSSPDTRYETYVSALIWVSALPVLSLSFFFFCVCVQFVFTIPIACSNSVFLLQISHARKSYGACLSVSRGLSCERVLANYIPILSFFCVLQRNRTGFCQQLKKWFRIAQWKDGSSKLTRKTKRHHVTWECCEFYICWHCSWWSSGAYIKKWSIPPQSDLSRNESDGGLMFGQRWL